MAGWRPVCVLGFSGWGLKLVSVCMVRDAEMTGLYNDNNKRKRTCLHGHGRGPVDRLEHELGGHLPREAQVHGAVDQRLQDHLLLLLLLTGVVGVRISIRPYGSASSAV